MSTRRPTRRIRLKWTSTIHLNQMSAGRLNWTSKYIDELGTYLFGSRHPNFKWTYQFFKDYRVFYKSTGVSALKYLYGDKNEKIVSIRIWMTVMNLRIGWIMFHCMAQRSPLEQKVRDLMMNLNDFLKYMLSKIAIILNVHSTSSKSLVCFFLYTHQLHKCFLRIYIMG